MLRATWIWPFFLLATPCLARPSAPSFCCLRVHRSERHVSVQLGPFRKVFPLQSNRNIVPNDEITAVEKQVLASAKSRIDVERVLKALNEDDSSPMRNELMYDDEDLARPTTSSRWQIAIAAAGVTAGASFVASQNYYIAIFIGGFVFVTATLDDDSLSGALARILGRSTIRSVQASQPKIKALARAVVTGEEEIVSLKAKVKRLEDENASLLLWKERRIKVDEALPRYTVTELKEAARLNGLVLGGTKSELLFRLVEADVIRLE
jgi:hypothetical protein